MSDLTYSQIPQDIQNDLRAYVAGKHPYPFGSFVTAVLANDLVGALGQADENNRAIIFDYASYLYNEMPGRSGDPTRDFWGSYEAVRNRIAEQHAAYKKAAPPPQEEDGG
jgi:hypothetical protein